MGYEKRMVFRLFLIFFLLVTSHCLLAQRSHSSNMEPQVLNHEIDVFFGNTHIPEASLENSTTTLILPNIGLNYKYWFDDHFGIGSYNNLIVRTFVINSDNYQDLERKYPFITSIVGIFKPWKNLSLYAGPGVQLSKTQSLFVIRLGVDYGINLSNNWYLSPRFTFDNLGNDIEGYTFGLSVSKRF